MPSVEVAQNDILELFGGSDTSDSDFQIFRLLTTFGRGGFPSPCASSSLEEGLTFAQPIFKKYGIAPRRSVGCTGDRCAFFMITRRCTYYMDPTKFKVPAEGRAPGVVGAARGWGVKI